MGCLGEACLRSSYWKRTYEEEDLKEECSGRGNSECKGPEAGTCFVFLRNSEETCVAGAGNGGKREE